MKFVSRRTKLNLARLQDRAAKREALQFGLGATMPLTAIRLGELCALGEKMITAARALTEAEDSVFNNLGPASLDFVIPDR